MADLDTEVREEPETGASFSAVEGDAVGRRHRLWLMVVLHVVLVVVGLSGVWAALGLARPTQRSVVVLLISAVLGALFVFTIREARGETYFYIISIMLVQAGVLIASLLVVRSCGYRLVRKSASEEERLE